jgi:hypothetical protein
VFLNQRVAEFSFFTPSAPPLTYSFKQTRLSNASFVICTMWLITQQDRQIRSIEKSVLPQVGSLMIADSLEGLGRLADDIRVSAGCGFA